ncbi:ESPR domain-containing protein [Budvicia aquatica]|uniref:ESPR domain-containing protein n=1 Tax=Budvicia aquatica TaxID=82979 RepID=A0A484ZWL2_9GAMM|nr:ESPR domain-containing protein [Budvicia aquatica]VFS52178.1 Uncharacterised protein [Budvicia aquatica]
MNKIYRIIWNNVLGTWTVTSELGRGKVKSSTNKTLAGIGLGLSLLSASAFSSPHCDTTALTCDLTSSWDFVFANSGAETMFVNDGKNYTVSGPSIFNDNTSSGRILMTADDAIDQGYITNTTEKSNGKPLIAFGNKDNTAVVTDPQSGVTSTVNMYHSDKITQSLRNPVVNVIDLSVTSAPYYYQAGFVKVTNGEATINVVAPRISASFKDTQLASAVSTTTDAKVIWASDNIVAQGANVTSATQETAQTSYYIYANSITAFDGSTIEIKDLAGLRNYNNWLIEQVKGRKLAGTAYDSQLAKAYTVRNVTYLVNPVPVGTVVNDPILTADVGVFAPLHASGSKATAVLTGSLTGTVNHNSNEGISMVMLENGSTGINQGRISSWGFGYGVIVKSGSTFINQGLINNNDSPVITYLSRVNGQNSHYINDTQGIINLSPGGSFTIDSSYGFFLFNGGKVTNKGIINLSDADRVNPGRVFGIFANSGTFDNQGLMTLGLKADGTAVNTSVESQIVNLASTGGANTNSGQMILGEKAQGSTAVRISHVGNANFTNSGTIDILGEKSETAASNIGISATGKTYGINNSGTINVKGTNNIGLHVYNGAQASSSGDINVVGKQTANKLNNFGVWVESLGSITTVSGTVNVTGDNAIAIHAKNQGQINLTGNGRVTFADGENQIGYYIYGAGSKINNTSSGAQDVTTKNSTLMRLDGGATFTGSSASTSTMSASGDNSTVIVATGTGTQVDSGGMTVNVNGKNATGFLIEGGATGNIGSTATIKLSGEGAIAGIADGQGDDLTGAEKTMTEAEKKATSLTAGANLNSSLNGVVGYIARNLATLTNSGSITFSGDNTTGIQVEEGRLA